MSILRAPENCAVCGVSFVDGDTVVFERKAKVVAATGPRRWTRDGVVRDNYLGIWQSSARVTKARHAECPVS